MLSGVGRVQVIADLAGDLREVVLHGVPERSAATPQRLYVPRELWFLAVFAFVMSYVMFNENGAVLTQHWEFLHEFFHDGRHVFGVPCH